MKHLESKWLDAINDADVTTIANTLSDDFVRPAPEYAQFANKAEVLSYYRSHLSAHSSVQRRIEDLTVSVYDTTAIARGRVVTSNSDGKVVSETLFTDVFVQHDGRWQAVSAQENSVPVQ